jgi:hypothetical protein
MFPAVEPCIGTDPNYGRRLCTDQSGSRAQAALAFVIKYA